MVSDSDLLQLGKDTHTTLCAENSGRREMAFYGCAWEDGKQKIFENTACHMGLMKNRYQPEDEIKPRKIGGPCVISNQVQMRRDKEYWIGAEALHKYYSFLFNESVFKDCYVTKDPEVVFDDGITVRTDKPANLVVAACIATRQAWEYKDVALTLNRLVSMGVTPRKAHLTAHLMVVDKDLSYSLYSRGGHVAVYSNLMGEEAVKNFLNGEVCKEVGYNCRTYQDARTYSGIPNMWGRYGHALNFPEGRENRLKGNVSDPFGFIKHVGEIEVETTAVVVNATFRKIGVK